MSSGLRFSPRFSGFPVGTFDDLDELDRILEETDSADTPKRRRRRILVNANRFGKNHALAIEVRKARARGENVHCPEFVEKLIGEIEAAVERV